MAREQRRLAAIVAADVVGYSLLMGRDESGTLARLRAHRTDLIDPAIAAHDGRIVKIMGDGLLLEFPSAVDATRCAIEVQRAMAVHNADVPESERIVFRIGVNLGDIIIDGDDIHGDGVNVAARLEAEASAGGIVLAGAVHDAVFGRVKATFEDLGELSLKNIERPVRAYRVRVEGAAASAPVTVPAPADVPLALPDKPSIAVLPFQNMSGDPEQEYFADGMVEDIITALSRFKSLFVVARNSTFTYKGRAVDIKQVGRELGVRYVLEGSVRKAGGRVRITGQLIDSQTGAHLWADRFDGSLEDVFGLQDQVTTSVVGAIAPKLDKAEMERAARKPVENLDAYDCFLRGMAQTYGLIRESWQVAARQFYRAIELDPGFSTPYGLAARCCSVRRMQGWATDTGSDDIEVRRLNLKVQAIGYDDAVALCWTGHALTSVCRDWDTGTALIDQALAINPNLAVCWQTRGFASIYLGQHEAAIDQVTRALRLSPLDPENYRAEGTMAHALLLLGRHDEALTWVTKALVRQPGWTYGLRVSAVANAAAGRAEDAQSTVMRLRKVIPAMRVSTLANYMNYKRPQDYDKMVEGLRLAGLPE